MKTKTFTFSELRNFVNSQKDNRQINMAHGSDLGCVLTHFLRKRFRKKIGMCGITMASFDENDKTAGHMQVISEDGDILERYMMALIREQVSDYATAKKLLNSKSYV